MEENLFLLIMLLIVKKWCYKNDQIDRANFYEIFLPSDQQLRCEDMNWPSGQPIKIFFTGAEKIILTSN